MCSFNLFAIDIYDIALSFVLGKLFLEKRPFNLGSQLKYIVILILLQGWSRTKKIYPYDPY